MILKKVNILNRRYHKHKKGITIMEFNLKLKTLSKLSHVQKIGSNKGTKLYAYDEMLVTKNLFVLHIIIPRRAKSGSLLRRDSHIQMAQTSMIKLFFLSLMLSCSIPYCIFSKNPANYVLLPITTESISHS
jgi:hypothetical protein